MPRHLVILENLSLFIPGDRQRRNIFQGINWRLPQGEHTLILGDNGAGKSTFLRLLHGEIPVSSGNISWLCGSGYESSRIAALAMSELISPALQEHCQRQAWNVTVGDLLASGTFNLPMSAHAYASLADKDARCIADLLLQLESPDLLRLEIPALSQGQLRLALFARALLRKPKLLLLDELTDGLDARHRGLVFELLHGMASDTTMVFTGHRHEMVPPWVGSVWRLADSTLHPACLPAKRRPAGRPRPAQARTIPGRLLLRLENVDVYVERKKVLHGLNWQVRAGEHWLVTGPNGSGKSTLLRLLSGDEFVASGGQIFRYDESGGQLLRDLPGIRKNIHLVSDHFQAVYGYPCTALELVCSGYDNTVGIYHELAAGQLAFAKSLISMAFPNQETHKLCETSIRELSGGQLRRLYLVRAIIGRPRILLLDEPFTGLDQESRQAFLNLLNSPGCRGLAGYQPTVILVSHNEEDAPAWIENVARLDHGRLSIVSNPARSTG